MSEVELCCEHSILSRDIEAQITFFSTTEGGRKSPAKSGYRCQFRYDGQDWFGMHTFPNVENVYPGDTVKSYVTFLNPEEHRSGLCIGKEFFLVEGAHVTARGIVTRIIELENRKNAPLNQSYCYPD